MIKAMAFDYAGVVAPGALKAWFRENITDEQKRDLYFTEITKYGDIGAVDVEEFLGMISKRTGIPRNNVYETIYGSSKLNQDVVSIIQNLKANYKIALFSNNQSEIVKRILKQNNALNLFDRILISSDYRLIKPDSKFFEKLVSILEVTKEELVFIDDSMEHVIASNKLGIKAFLYLNPEVLKKDLLKIKILI